MGDIQLASHDMEQLSTLEKANRRQDRQQVETLLAQERGLRTAALADAGGIQKEAAHWIDVKRHLLRKKFIRWSKSTVQSTALTSVR